MLELLEKPYSLRQFVVVERDEIIATKLKAQEVLLNEKQLALANEGSDDDKNALIKKAVEVALAGVKALGVFVVAGGVGAILADLVIKSIEKQKELSKNISVNYISFTQSTELKFPIGHPRENELYIAHPTSKGTYYTINEFHKKTFEHKFSELNTILMDLGVKKVEVEYISGWNLSLLNEFETRKIIKGKLDLNSSKERKIIYNAGYKDNISKELPSDLAWYHHESTWQNIGEGRLNHDLQNFNLTLSYNDDFGIDSDLYVRICKVGFGAKNKFQKKECTVWNIVGEF